MQYLKMSKNRAEKWVYDKDIMKDDTDWLAQKMKWNSFIVDDYDSRYTELRKKVISVYKDSMEKSDYELDLAVGMCVYRELNLESGFTEQVACDDEVWIYLTCIVFPDITYLRYPKPNQGDTHIAKKRFYSHTRRIWLKSLWWYIHLSWQGSEETTMAVLREGSVDNINKLYEQPGRGFRKDLSRAYMLRYSQVASDKKSSILFEKIQKQNLVNCRTVEPILTNGGVTGYIEKLFEEFGV